MWGSEAYYVFHFVSNTFIILLSISVNILTDFNYATLISVRILYAQMSMKFILLINVKMRFQNLNFLAVLHFNEQLKTHAQPS